LASFAENIGTFSPGPSPFSVIVFQRFLTRRETYLFSVSFTVTKWQNLPRKGERAIAPRLLAQHDVRNWYIGPDWFRRIFLLGGEKGMVGDVDPSALRWKNRDWSLMIVGTWTGLAANNKDKATFKRISLYSVETSRTKMMSFSAMALSLQCAEFILTTEGTTKQNNQSGGPCWYAAL
jgi:hypothetical protein